MPRTNFLTEDLHLASSKGFEAIVESVAFQPEARTIAFLSLVGQPAAMKALHACFVLHTPVEITGVGPCEWPTGKDNLFHMIHRRLPCGAHASLWIPTTGTVYGIQPEHPAYIIQKTADASGIPQSFLPILDRLLPCPLLPQWAPALWEHGLHEKWILPLQSYGCQVWKITPHRHAITRWIETALRQHRLPAPNAPTESNMHKRGRV